MLSLSGFQDIYEAIFGRAFAHYRPALAAFVDTLGAKPEKVIRDSAKAFGYALTTLVLETMPQESIRALLVELSDRVSFDCPSRPACARSSS